MKSKNLIYIITVLLLASCGRNRSDSSETEEPEIENPIIKDTTSITAEDPFRNQPNELCTMIRKLDISYYSPTTVTDAASAFPKKYCLLDICLETVDPAAMTINIGEDGETVSTTFQLIKIFNSYDDAKAYADEFKIQDVKWEEAASD